MLDSLRPVSYAHIVTTAVYTDVSTCAGPASSSVVTVILAGSLAWLSALLARFAADGRRCSSAAVRTRGASGLGIGAPTFRAELRRVEGIVIGVGWLSGCGVGFLAS